MITFVVHLRVRPEHATQFEALLTHVCESVREHEPGVVYYAFARSVDEPNTYVVIEVYRDIQARAAHMLTDWVQRSLPKSAALVIGTPDIRQYVSPGSEPVPPHARLQMPRSGT